MNLDPRYLLAKETGFADHDQNGDRHAVIIELADGASLARNAALQKVIDALGGHGGIALPFFKAPTDLRVATAWATAQGLLRLESLAESGKLLKRFEYAQNLKPPRLRYAAPLKLPSMGAKESQQPNAFSVPGEKARMRVRNVFAVIDYGCPFMHPLLTHHTTGKDISTRVRALWDQQPDATVVAYAPPGFSYGTELTRAHLDAAIQSSEGDESRAYWALGYEAMRQPHSHGAHALGMLLDDRRRLRQPGSDRRLGDVLFVQLPQGLMGAPSRAVLSRCLIDALVWIEAQRQDNERVILSLGGGSSQGPHDGSSMVEKALQAFTSWGPEALSLGAAQAKGRPYKHRIYIAAGNGRSEQLHAKPFPKPGAPRSLIWRVPPASELPASLELWVPLQADGRMAQIEIELFAPGGVRVGTLSPGASLHWPDVVRPAASMVSSAWAGSDCTLSLLRIAPTAALASSGGAPWGDWRLELRAKQVLPGPVNAYIGRIKPALGFPLRTSQSTFVRSKEPGHVGPRKDGTVQGLATAVGVMRGGGHVGVGRQLKSAPYSAKGPSRDGRGLGPELSVRVDDGDVLRGRRSIGNRSGVTFRMDGTSVAAPLAARLDLTTRPLDSALAAPRDFQRPIPAAPDHQPQSRRLKDEFDG